MRRALALLVLLACFLAPRLFAGDVDFVRDVRPIFEKHCDECHGAKKQKSGLRLDVKSAAFKGGDGYGASIVAGKTAESPLIELVTSADAETRMPPNKPALSAAEIETLTKWIAEGANWPDGVDTVTLKDNRDHWSFKPLAVAPGAHSIDSFVAAKLKERGLTFSPEADRVSWLRRVTFDLTGLPPTPEEVKAFVADNDAEDYERVVDRLLQSPRYGERWAQHWLDVVRYADTHGFEVNTERPNAWHYRDYVINAMNANTPYDQFIREQIAGDVLGKDTATGFLITASVLLPGQIGADEPSKRLARQDALDEIVTNVSQTFLGMSIGCARCHDHKFDPISQRDYYAMQAFVAGVEYEDRELLTPEAIAHRQEAVKMRARIIEIDQLLTRFSPLAKSGIDRPMVNARQNVDRVEPIKTQRVRFTILATNNLEPCIDELEIFNQLGANLALASSGAKVTSSGNNVSPDRHELRFVNDGEYGNSRSWMSSEMGKGWVEIEFPALQEIERVVWGRDRQSQYTDRLAIEYRLEAADAAGQLQLLADSTDRRKFDAAAKSPTEFVTTGLPEAEVQEATALIKERAELDAKIKVAENVAKAFAGKFRTPDEIRLLSRGDPEQPKDVVHPAIPTNFQATEPEKLSAQAVSKESNTLTPEQARRMELADWIASPQNPLTARVMVNRIWQGHFGAGIVLTSSDFGNNGAAPSNPPLLDWLASEFIQSGWSIKEMHKRIVLSQTYRQTSVSLSSAASSQDADVQLLWRYPTRRLEAETIRDSILAVSGKLNLAMHGRGFDLFNQRGGLSGFSPVESFSGEGLRRMIYAHKVRREREAVFGAFDCPDAGQSTDRRRESTTPLQALNLFNSRFTLEQSDAFANRIKSLTGEDIDDQIRQAYQLTLSREPTSSELADAKEVVTAHGLPVLCRVLFNSNEFLFIP